MAFCTIGPNHQKSSHKRKYQYFTLYMKEFTDLHLAPSGIHPMRSCMTQLCRNTSNCCSFLLIFSDIAQIITIHNFAKSHAPSPLSVKRNSMFYGDFACGTKMKAVIFLRITMYVQLRSLVVLLSSMVIEYEIQQCYVLHYNDNGII